MPSKSKGIENNEVIPFDMNSGNLQIKTESTAESNDKMRVHLYDKTGYINNYNGHVGTVSLFFSIPPTYEIDNCGTNGPKLPSSLLTGGTNIWEISKHPGASRITVQYNGDKVLDITCNQSVWSRDVKRIKVGKQDTVSKFYRQTTPTGYHSCYLNNNLLSQLLR